jgi:S-DNA-T family DNA segregation ATPase FtsK/SpoIIIE
MTIPSPQRDNEHSDAQLITFPIQPPTQAPEPPRPSSPAGGAIEPAPEVLDGELITETEYQQRTRLRRVTAVVVRGADRTRGATAAVAPRVAPPARVLARVVYTIGAGHVSWARRAAGALTHAPVREQIRRARAMGDPAALAEWTERLVSLKDKRAKRLRELPATLLGAAKALAAALAALLVLIGVWVAVRPGGMGWSDWWSLVGGIANGAGTVMYAGVSVAVWLLVPLCCSLGGWRAAVWRPRHAGWRRLLTPTSTWRSTRRLSPTLWRRCGFSRSPPTSSRGFRSNTSRQHDVTAAAHTPCCACQRG